MVDINVLDLSLYADGMFWYDLATVKEDKATLGSDLSAFTMPHGMGRYLTVPPIFTTATYHAGGHNAINPFPVIFQEQATFSELNQKLIRPIIISNNRSTTT
jgi:hypothetical protein